MLVEVDQKVERFMMAFSSGEILLHSMCDLQRLFFPHGRTKFIAARRSQRRDTAKSSLDPEATGSFKQCWFLLPRPLKTGSKGDLMLSGNMVAADAVAQSSPGFRGSPPWSTLSTPI